jgi:hypothetical protein
MLDHVALAVWGIYATFLAFWNSEASEGFHNFEIRVGKFVLSQQISGMRGWHVGCLKSYRLSWQIWSREITPWKGWNEAKRRRGKRITLYVFVRVIAVWCSMLCCQKVEFSEVLLWNQEQHLLWKLHNSKRAISSSIFLGIISSTLHFSDEWKSFSLWKRATSTEENSWSWVLGKICKKQLLFLVWLDATIANFREFFSAKVWDHAQHSRRFQLN